MPLSAPAPREPIHRRSIELQGFQRADGLWDIEAHLIDRRGYHFENFWRGKLPIGEPIHDMWLRLTIDDGFLIHAVEAVMEAHPFPSCPAVTGNFQRLVGLHIGSGWRRALRERLGGTAGCTHLVELLAPLATAAFQTIAPLRKAQHGADRRAARLVDSCHGWRSDGEAVQVSFPDRYTGS
jgi:hypothetical protein